MKRVRAFTLILASTVALVGPLLVASPGSAASQAGTLQIRGPGTLYSGDGVFVTEAVSPGTADKFELRVLNTGTSLAQYNIKVETGGLPAATNLYAGSLVLTPLSSGPDGYYTAPIAAGKYQALVLKITIPVGSPQGSSYARVHLFSTDGNALATVSAETELKAPTKGTTSHDLFVKNGSQPYIGGSITQTSTSPALKLGDSTVFTVKAQNDGPVTAVSQLYYHALTTGPNPIDNKCVTVTIKLGTVDVTDTFKNSAYSAALAPGASLTFKVTMTRTGSAGCGAFDFGMFGNFASTFEKIEEYVSIPYPAS